MSDKLTLLRENYCRPADLVEEADKDLFPLERNTEQGRTLIAKAPWKSLPYLEFDPSGLKQTYWDEKTHAELPVFAVFNLEGSNELHAYIGAKRKSSYGAVLRLANHLPFAKAQKFLESDQSAQSKGMARRQLLLPSARGTGGYRRRPHSWARPAERSSFFLVSASTRRNLSGIDPFRRHVFCHSALGLSHDRGDCQ